MLHRKLRLVRDVQQAFHSFRRSFGLPCSAVSLHAAYAFSFFSMNNTIVNVSPRGFSPNEMMDCRGVPPFLTVHAASHWHLQEPRTLNTGKTYPLRFSGCAGENNFVKSQGEGRRVEYLTTEESQVASACFRRTSRSNREGTIESV